MAGFERVDSRTVQIAGKNVTFDKDVEGIVEYDGHIVILLYTGDYEEGDPMAGRNILGFDSEGNQVWRVEDHGFMIGADEENMVPQSFMSIGIGPESGKLKAGIPAIIFTLDAKSGLLSEPEYNR